MPLVTSETVIRPEYVVGFGNPGAEYASTRHNVGAWLVRLLAKRYRARYPFAEASPEALAALAAVPDGPLDPMVRRTAARVLMEPEEAPTPPTAP